MRITGGEMGGRRLRAPKGSAIRPTSDKSRESLFNILGGLVIGRDFLDLFAGTGAMGIEAVSRGARSAVFVEAAGPALDLIRRNIDLCGVADRTRIVRGFLPGCLASLARSGLEVGVAFLDPPYGFERYAETVTGLVERGIVRAGAWIVVEHFSKVQLEINRPGLVQTDVRRYGDTRLSFYRVTESTQTDPESPA